MHTQSVVACDSWAYYGTIVYLWAHFDRLLVVTASRAALLNGTCTIERLSEDEWSARFLSVSTSKSAVPCAFLRLYLTDCAGLQEFYLQKPAILRWSSSAAL